jgi:hypothetical protein
MKKIIIATALLFLFSCSHTVEFVRKESTPQKQAIVRYPPSSEKNETKYREDLKKQAHQFCSGDYEITKEYQARDESSSSAGVATGIGIGHSGSVIVGGSGPRTSMYNFVEFICK